MNRNKNFIIVESINSILWFSMDSLWMFGYLEIAKFLIIPTIIAGLISAFEKLDAGNISVSMAVNAWLIMNVFWMLDMMTVSKIFFFIGILLIIVAIALSKSLTILKRFKRFKK